MKYKEILRGKGDRISNLPFMEGGFLILIILTILELEAYPTPK